MLLYALFGRVLLGMVRRRLATDNKQRAQQCSKALLVISPPTRNLCEVLPPPCVVAPFLYPGPPPPRPPPPSQPKPQLSRGPGLSPALPPSHFNSSDLIFAKSKRKQAKRHRLRISMTPPSSASSVSSAASTSLSHASDSASPKTRKRAKNESRREQAKKRRKNTH